MSRKSLLAVLALVAVIAAVPASASAAKIPVAVGIGDQNPSIFDQANFKRLKVKKVRYFIRWNAMDNPYELGLADAYINAAKANKVRVLLHISSDTLIRASEAKKKGLESARLPSVAEYKQKVGFLIDRYGGRNIDWGTWNEINHDSQPTWNNPKRAAKFFVAMRQMCKGCNIVALDLLDQRGVAGYIKRWFRGLKKSQRRAVKVVGIHNYSDTNRYRQKRRPKGQMTAQIIRAVKRYNKRTKYYLTETGGLAKFGSSFPCGSSKKSQTRALKRQARAIADMFKLVKRFRRQGVQRLYSYNWWGTDCTSRFDAGLVKADGSARPAYKTFRKQASRFKR
jgi:hypothetical protein